MGETVAKPLHQYNLDWLRVFVILNLIPFHVAWLMTFVKGFSHVPQDTSIAMGLKIYVVFMGNWIMPLLFLSPVLEHTWRLNFVPQANI